MSKQQPDHSDDVPPPYVVVRDPHVAQRLEQEAQAIAKLAALRQAPRVLHVDGDGDAALVLATLLVPETQVTHVHTLAAAQRAIAHDHFALVVLDPDLPDGDGAALIAALREAQAATPVLLYSARHPDGRSEVHAFLPKPWTSPRQLWRTVSQLLGLSADASPEIPV